MSADWRDCAECAGTPDGIFFPASSARVDKTPDYFWLNARAICAVCPVIADCAEDALKHEEWGFRGGMTPAEQASLRRKARRARKARTREARDDSCRGCGTALATRARGSSGPAPEGTVWHHARSLCRTCHYATKAAS